MVNLMLRPTPVNFWSIPVEEQQMTMAT